MRDFTSHEYCDFLWINDILSLEKRSNNDFKAVVKECGKEKCLTISNVTIFGTIVEVKPIGERGVLYLVDDGTGIITCKYNEANYSNIFDRIQTEQGMVLNESFSNQSLNESQMNYSLSEDDTIFNDNTLQEEEAEALKRCRSKALHSIWSDIEDSFSSMIGILDIGETVLVQGKLYNYFHQNQIHVNTIRRIDLKEEMILTSVKLEDGFQPLVECERSDPNAEIQLIENKRKSGVMTFDHIHPVDRKEIPSPKLIIQGEKFEKELAGMKRRSIVLPQLNGAITFDTLIELNDSGPPLKMAKFDDLNNTN